MQEASAVLSRLCGRQAEQAAIATLLESASAGRGEALILHGESGVGKSALLAYAAARAADFAVVQLRGDRSERTLPFAALHRLLELVPSWWAQPLAGSIDQLRCGAADGSDHDRRFQAYLAVLDVIRGVAADRPLLCCVDDGQWIDQPSLDVLAFVARRLGGHRIAMLFSHLDEYRFDAGSAERPAGIATHRVPPLTEDGSRELVRDLLPADSVAAAVAVAAGGNPQVLLDLAGALSLEQRHGLAPAPLTLPSGSRIRRAYRAKLAALPDAARRLVVLAGADPDLTGDELLRAAEEAEIEIAALERAESAGVLRIEDGALIFPHAVLRGVAYDEATYGERRSSHLLLARTLDAATEPLRRLVHLATATHAPDDELADRLAAAVRDDAAGGAHALVSRALERAAELSGPRPAAALRLVAAARHAWRGGDLHRARMLLWRARPATTTARARARWEMLLGEIELRTGETIAASQRLLATADSSAQRDRHLAVNALLRAGDALSLAGDYTRFSDLAGRAMTLRRLDDSTDAEFMAEHFAGLSATFLGEHDRATWPLRRSVALAAVIDEPATLVRASLAAIVHGDPARAHHLATRATALARNGGDVSALPQALEFAALAEMVMGRFDTTATALEGLRLARLSGQHSLVSSQLATLALLAANLGDRDTCLARIREARAVPLARNVGRSQALIEWALAVLDLTSGQYDKAVVRLRGITRLGGGNGHLIVRVGATPHLVEAAVHAGQQALAHRSLATFDSWAGSTGNAHWRALSARCHALLAPAPADAYERFQQALRWHDLSPMEFDRARTQLLFGQWLRRRRQRAVARKPLRDALEIFERFHARPWAEQARAELRATGEPVSSPEVLSADRLTPHQLKIAQLVAEGATNQEVAARLQLSRRTVDHHLRNIFAKLDVRSRVELTRMIR
jgi:DNA-binding CsgD family transcriptional regulator